MTRRPTASDFRPPGGLTAEQQSIARRALGVLRGPKRTVAEVAALCGLSRGHFIRAFRTSVGETPHRWSRQRRIEAAKLAIRETDAPIAVVAMDCGFADQSHLTRIFSDEVGVSPAAYRRIFGVSSRTEPTTQAGGAGATD